MKKVNFNPRPSSLMINLGVRKKSTQIGAVTLLFVLFATLGLLAISAKVLQYVRATSAIQYAEHTITQADMKAWTGVSLVYEALKKLSASQVAALTAGSVTLSGVQSGISVTYSGNYSGSVPTNSTYAMFQVTGSSAGANTVLQAVYSYVPPTSVNLGNQLLFGRDTTFTGNVIYSGATPLAIGVTGSLTLTNASISNFGSVCATGNVSINSAINVTSICSNGNVTLAAGASVNQTSGYGPATINAQGNVLLVNGNVQVNGTINSNGTVTLDGGSGHADYINAQNNVTVRSNASVCTIKSNTNITYSSGSTQCPSGESFGLYANGTISSTQSNSRSHIGGVSVSSVAAYAPVTYTVDANDSTITNNVNIQFISNGNQNGCFRVYVNNYNGITAGYYYLSGENLYRNNQNCNGQATYTLCSNCGFNNISYSSASSTWSVACGNGYKGVVWFSGDLAMVNNCNNPSYYSAFIATGSITISNGNSSYYPPNYSSSQTCSGSYYPTQLCSGSSALSNASIGNVAFMAGSYTAGIFSGGNVSLSPPSLGGRTDVYGAILAGNYLTAGANVSVIAMIYSAGQNTSDTSSVNAFSSQLVINDPGGTTGSTVPITISSTSSSSSSSTSTSPSVGIVWVSPI